MELLAILLLAPINDSLQSLEDDEGPTAVKDLAHLKWADVLVGLVEQQAGVV